MTYAEYGRVRHERPYVLEISQGKGRIVYFGIGHTRDPRDPQLAEARRLWRELRPELALNEGGTPPKQPTPEAAVGIHGEPGLLRYWAEEAGVPIRSIDPDRKTEIAALVGLFPEDRLKVFYTLRSLEQALRRPPERRGSATPEQIASLGLARAGGRGLPGAPRTAAELDEFWKTLGIAGDWREPKLSWFDPGEGGAGTPLNAIATASSRFRDQHIVNALIEELKTGRRVFAMIGASHVVMQEPALRAAMPDATIRKLRG